VTDTSPNSAPLPTGVVTFMFTDIEGSSKLVHELGNQYPEVLNLHHRLLRAAFVRHAGVEVVTTGDGFFVAFAEARAALDAAVEAQRTLAVQEWPQGATVAVRIGLHTGVPTVVDGDYVGLDVHRAARIAGAAHGGQVVVSETTYELLDGFAATKDLGIHRLKGLAKPEHILQVVAPGLRGDFPPLKSLNPPTNIPRRIDSIVGRTAEVDELRLLLVGSDDRLITIHGPGGAGKTRLAVHVAVGLLDHFVDGAFFVDLTPVTAGGVELAIADALGFGLETDGADIALSHAIGDKRMLLVLDNFEQAIAAADRVRDLVQSCINLRLLVTSQVVLRVRGEREYPLAPLGLPSDSSVEAVLRSDAAQLFARRAAAARPEFEIGPHNSAAIGEICRLVDGLPLALELAAARTRLFSVNELVDRLGDSMGLLAGGLRDVPARHQTLSATVDWSYGLLSPSDQAFFRDFAVFSGGASLAAIEAVIATEGNPLDALMSLVEHSLIRRSGGDGQSYFSMLQTIRGYALELLDADPDRDRVRERHASFYLDLATANTEDRDHSLDREMDNFRSALEWWLRRAENGEGKVGAHALQLATALANFWYKHGHAVEGIGWFERALAVAPDPPPELHAAALRRLGILVEVTGDLTRARQLFGKALDSFRTAGAQDGEAATLNSLGVVMRSLGDLDAAEELFESAIDLRNAMGDEAGLSAAISNLGITAADADDFDRAEHLFEAALSLDRKLNDEWAVTVDANNLAVVHFERGDYGQAKRMSTQALRGFSENGDLDGVAESLEISAGIAGQTGDPVSAARLAGAADALRAAAGLPLAPPDRVRFERWMTGPRASLSTADFERNWDEGAAMTAQQATSYALRGSPDESEPTTLTM
jgi:predicted ATPase/class 3 adenylate cyclase/Tfp pilus assembly protein PilF